MIDEPVYQRQAAASRILEMKARSRSAAPAGPEVLEPVEMPRHPRLAPARSAGEATAIRRQLFRLR